MHVLIIEDESRIAKRLHRMTTVFFGSVLNKIKNVDSLEEATEYLKNNTLDLVLLDLNLNGEDGFEILKSTVSESFHTIIVSAHKENAIKAFEYGVLDFVAKPFNRDRLELALNRSIQRERIATETIKYLGVKKRGSIQFIDVENILYVRGAGVYAELVLKNGKTELHDKSLEKLEQLLPDSFERIHKSYLLRITEMDEIQIQTGSKYTVKLKNGEVLPIGRTRYKDLKTKLFG